ncbi:NADP-dependent oxidoreductase [Fulvivirga sp. RKSG066]|uniref:NADP-dependent oxidoreductase n=1 Tax=Fulvivirga aurantia TaxID=2529383 RepID=UPI0012BC95A7|nr:NADP-dependent oxidoreductase [Fulvivirga aurantia]MTI20102.1 NADP-dependent oxidoreductase [Fulvivirga aurantia]
MNKTILLDNRPQGKPSHSDFKFVENDKPSPKDGEVLLKTCYVSVDPYLRGRMIDQKSYIEPFELNKPLSSGIIAEVVESKIDDFSKGDYVSAMLDWKEYQVSDGQNLQKVDPDQAPLSTYLGVLGMTGLTAYFGLTDIGKPKEGETVVVSGAAGAVGTVVGQIAKIKGCRVVGIAGTDEKIDMIKSKFGFDEAVNYKTTSDMKKAIAEAAPDGVDVYFDNVGGPITDAVMANINRHGRVVACGAISTYNATETPTGPRLETTLIKKSVLMQGFTVGNYAEKFKEGVQQLASWMQSGDLTYTETMVEGFDNIPQAFIDLFDGKNEGKMVVKV